jgi:hypothetical protein
MRRPSAPMRSAARKPVSPGPAASSRDRLARPGIDLVDEPLGHWARAFEEVRAMAFPPLRHELSDLDRLRLIGLAHAGTLTNPAGRGWKLSTAMTFRKSDSNPDPLALMSSARSAPN